MKNKKIMNIASSENREEPITEEEQTKRRYFQRNQ